MPTGLATLEPGVFLGTTCRTARATGFTLVESIPEYRRQPLHDHANHYLYVVLGGGFEGVVGGPRRALVGRPMTVSFLPAGERHANLWFGDDRRCLNVEISADRARQLDAAYPLPREAVTVESQVTAALARKLALEVGAARGPHPLCLEGLVLELLAEITRPPAEAGDGPPRWLVRVRDRLRDCPNAVPGLDALADDAGVHPSHLSRAFRQHFGLTLGDYVRRERVDYACRRIAARPAEALVRVAAEAGFADQSHMSREFRHWLGRSPSAVRRGVIGPLPARSESKEIGS